MSACMNVKGETDGFFHEHLMSSANDFSLYKSSHYDRLFKEGEVRIERRSEQVHNQANHP